MENVEDGEELWTCKFCKHFQSKYFYSYDRHLFEQHPGGIDDKFEQRKLLKSPKSKARKSTSPKKRKSKSPTKILIIESNSEDELQTQAQSQSIDSPSPKKSNSAERILNNSELLETPQTSEVSLLDESEESPISHRRKSRRVRACEDCRKKKKICPHVPKSKSTEERRSSYTSGHEVREVSPLV